MGFSGFPEAGLAFLRELGAHNDKDWFEAHRAAWDEQIVPAMLSWCSELTESLRDVMPRAVFVPRVGGSLFRLNRDTRFSRDKRPYKTHVAAAIWEGEREKHDAPAVYLEVSPAQITFAGGIWTFEEARLDRFRKLLHSEASAERLDAALAQAKKAGLAIDAAEKLPRPPRGFDPESPRAELAKYKGLSAARRVKPAPWLYTREALERSVTALRAYAPLHAWMRDELCA